MNEEPVLAPTPDQARAALAEVDLVLAQTRHAIRQGVSAPLLILWGCIWIVADLTTQFQPQIMAWLWWVLDLAGILGWVLIFQLHGQRVKNPRGWRYGAAWGILFFYGVMWINLLVPVDWPQTNDQWIAFEPVFRRITAYFHTLPMFAYVLGGLWLDPFFIWLGAIVTALIVLGFCFVHEYFYLWLAVTGGGALVVSGVFIKKFWK
jgi:hypothetical protein